MATFVLIHGAYQGGWIWQRVAQRLRAAGHLVYAPSLDGCAERRHSLRSGITTASHAAEIAELLLFEDLREAVLVGTSAGGMVLCRAAELARERIGRLVFVDALALLSGERIADIVRRSTPRVATALATGPSREDAEARLFADLEPNARAWALARYTPHPIAAMEEPVALDDFWDLPWRVTVVRCLRALNPPEAHQRRTAERLRARYVELDTGHYPMLSMPEELAGLLVQE
jgi:pimeloyl-ACP methyl ester carboxylesterase